MTRVSIDFTEDSFEELGNISNQLKTSKAETIRKALALLNLTLEEGEKGNSLVFENEKKKYKKEVKLI